MNDPDDFNQKVIAEFRSNNGKVGGFFADKTLLLLHTTGARSGEPRIHPLVCMEDEDNLFIIASAGGSHSHPAWYHNLVANPQIQIEYGSETIAVHAVIAEEPLRSKLYEKAAARYGFIAEYGETTAGIRTIPVIVLHMG